MKGKWDPKVRRGPQLSWRLFHYHCKDPVFESKSSTKASEGAADDNRDDDDDNDDDDDDAKLPSHDVDPERLKAFNVSTVDVAVTVLRNATSKAFDAKSHDQILCQVK